MFEFVHHEHEARGIIPTLFRTVLLCSLRRASIVINDLDYLKIRTEPSRLIQRLSVAEVDAFHDDAFINR
jgi:hypothetical protein